MRLYSDAIAKAGSAADAAPLYTGRAAAYLKLNLPTEALADAEHATELDPRSCQVRGVAPQVGQLASTCANAARVVSCRCSGLDSPRPSTVAGAQVPSSRRGTAAGAALRYRGRQPTQAGTLARAGYARHVPPMPHSSIASERAGERISRRSSNERTN